MQFRLLAILLVTMVALLAVEPSASACPANQVRCGQNLCC